MKKNVFGFVSGLMLSTALLLASATAAQAATGCKGLEEKACGANEACSWVKARTNKKGTEVKAHCRGKGGKKAEKADKAAKDAGKKAKAKAKG